jgi:hypothetical protein
LGLTGHDKPNLSFGRSRNSLHHPTLLGLSSPSLTAPPGVVSTMPVAKKSSRTQWPPVSIRDDETDAETRLRLNDEAEAKRISDEIDRQLDHERQQRSKVVGAKILLLGSYHVHYRTLGLELICLLGHDPTIVGQAESGKSTVLKNFQLLFAPKAFEREVC